ncbi:universal stress protein [Agrilactobacillus fermenti]|uniref:universal stress protein n=1 Tax=Agrilactobacillus fermenti TaxID=2586909 RepID=UPI001E3D6B54|nr:universal stress protein [Agrilactobacillus fermenti]MCD2257050.1 universal stress protein [Agrilactobacillus fermenti]
MFQKILVPIDGSERSLLALKNACNLAETLHAKIFILTVVAKHVYVASDSAYQVSTPDIHEIGTKLLQTAEKIARNYPNITYQTFLKEGDPRSVITDQMVKQLQPDLIVMGKTGTNRLARLLVGATARYVAENAKTNVLLIEK